MIKSKKRYTARDRPSASRQRRALQQLRSAPHNSQDTQLQRVPRTALRATRLYSASRPLPFHFFAKRRLRRNFGSIPLIGRRCPLPSDIGFLMPLRWFLYDWLCAVWLVDLAIFLLKGESRGGAG